MSNLFVRKKEKNKIEKSYKINLRSNLLGEFAKIAKKFMSIEPMSLTFSKIVKIANLKADYHQIIMYTVIFARFVI